MLVKVLSGKDFPSPPERKLLWITVMLVVCLILTALVLIFFQSSSEVLAKVISPVIISVWLFSYLFIFPPTCYLTVLIEHLGAFLGYFHLFSSVQFSCSVVSNSLRPYGLHTAFQASLSITSSWRLLKLMSIESVMPSNHLILCHPLLLLPSIFPSIRVFSNESVLCIRWPKYWRFSFSISPSNEY